jgi:hypothetical protein
VDRLINNQGVFGFNISLRFRKKEKRREKKKKKKNKRKKNCLDPESISELMIAQEPQPIGKFRTLDFLVRGNP